MRSSVNPVGVNPVEAHSLDLGLGSDPKAVSLELSSKVKKALQVLTTGDFQSQWDISKQFVDLGPAVIKPLMEVVQDTSFSWQARWFSIRILGEFKQPQVIALLARVMSSEGDEELSDLAARTLAAMGADTVAVLIPLLAKPPQRKLVVRALSQIRKTAVIEPLLTVVQDPDPDIRYLAIEALSSFHDDRVTPILLAALEDLHSPIRKAAITALGRRSDLVGSCQLIATLKPHLWDLDISVCQAVAIAMGRLGQDEAVSPLTQVLVSVHTPEILKVDAVHSLGWLQTSASIQALCDSFDPGSAVVQQHIIQALGKIDSSPLQALAAQFLMDLLTRETLVHQSIVVKQSLALSLGELNWSAAFDPLTRLLLDNHAGVRLHGVAALKQLDPDGAHKRLQQMLLDPDLDETWHQAIRDGLTAW